MMGYQIFDSSNNFADNFQPQIEQFLQYGAGRLFAWGQVWLGSKKKAPYSPLNPAQSLQRTEDASFVRQCDVLLLSSLITAQSSFEQNNMATATRPCRFRVGMPSISMCPLFFHFILFVRLRLRNTIHISIRNGEKLSVFNRNMYVYSINNYVRCHRI